MVSTVPWSSVSESDYTLQQWHNACLIHLHDGPPTSKAQCKLPVKMPNGVLNKNGVYAAAAALAGARSALKAPIEQKAMAARKLIGFYQQFNAKPPPSLFSLGHSMDMQDFLAHHGIKGQKWGVITKKGVFAAGRGIKKSAKFTKEHPTLVANTAAAALFIAGLATHKVNTTRAAASAAKGQRWINGTGEFSRELLGGPSHTIMNQQLGIINESKKILDQFK